MDEQGTLIERRSVTFRVLGDPAAQAGMKSVPIRGRGGLPVLTKDGRPMFRKVTEGTKGLKSWRQEVSEAAERAAAEAGGILASPVEVWMEWRFPMPASRPKWAKVLRLIPKITKPDGDKLQRAVFDSLKTGGLIADDAGVTNWHGAKVEVYEEWSGVTIRVAELPSGRP